MLPLLSTRAQSFMRNLPIDRMIAAKPPSAATTGTHEIPCQIAR